MVYDTPEEGLTQLIREKLDNDASNEINKIIVGSTDSKIAQKKIVSKYINTKMDNIIVTGWKSAYLQSQMLLKTQSYVEKLSESVIMKKQKITDNIMNLIFPLFQSTEETIFQVLTILKYQLISILNEPFEKLITTYNKKIESKFLRLCKINDYASFKIPIKNLIEEINVTKTNIKTHMNERIESMINCLINDKVLIIKNNIAEIIIELCKTIDTLLIHFLELLNPERWVKVVEMILRDKMIFENLHMNSQPKFSFDLEDIEYYSLHAASFESAKIGFNCKDLQRNFENISNTQLPEIFYELGIKFQRKLHFEVMKKFIMKFSDNVWEKANTGEDFYKYKEQINESFCLAYNSSKKKFIKNLKICIKKAIIKILAASLFEPIKSLIIKGNISSQINSMEKSIPTKMKDLIDIGEIFDHCIISKVKSIISATINNE